MLKGKQTILVFIEIAGLTSWKNTTNRKSLMKVTDFGHPQNFSTSFESFELGQCEEKITINCGGITSWPYLASRKKSMNFIDFPEQYFLK